MSDGFAQIQTFIRRITDQHRTPAAAIAIATNGKPLFTHIAGEASPGAPATDDTLWPLASISKLYTASAVMSLIEEGRLGMWSGPSAIFPEFTGGGGRRLRCGIG